MRIGELAARSGVAAKTIRYYEAVGVLAPPPRTPSGYRDYGDEALDRLGFVRAAQAVGLTLGEAREIAALRERGEAPCAHVADLLRRRAGELTESIAALEATRAELERLADRAATLRPEDCPPTVVCHLVAPAGAGRLATGSRTVRRAP